MKKCIFYILMGAGVVLSGCNANAYSSLRNKEDKLIDNYISRNNINVLTEEPALDYKWGENDYYEVVGRDRLFFHLVHRGDSSRVDTLSSGATVTVDQTIEINDIIVTRYKKFGLTENADTLNYWTTMNQPNPYEFFYGITSGIATGYTSICESVGWHEAVRLMRYPESECIVIVPSKLGFDADNTSVTPYGYRMKIKVKK